MRLHFEHSGFDLPQPCGEEAFQGAESGWAKMLKQLAAGRRQLFGVTRL